MLLFTFFSYLLKLLRLAFISWNMLSVVVLMSESDRSNIREYFWVDFCSLLFVKFHLSVSELSRETVFNTVHHIFFSYDCLDLIASWTLYLKNYF